MANQLTRLVFNAKLLWDRSQTLVLVFLADHADRERKCFLKVKSVANGCRMSIRHARNIIRKLEKAGIITTKQSGGKLCNTYTINVDKLLSLTPPDEDDKAEAASAGFNPEPMLAGLESPTRKTATSNAEKSSTQPGTSHCRQNRLTERRTVQTSRAAAGDESKSEHRKFTKLWEAAFEKHHKQPYVFQDGQDGSAIKKLLQATGKSASELVDIAIAAWSKGGFWCEHAVTIAGFKSKINQIQQELSKAGKSSGYRQREDEKVKADMPGRYVPPTDGRTGGERKL